MSRFFIGTHTTPLSEKWEEVGHFVEGVNFRMNRVRLKDGLLRLRTKGYGYKNEATYEPAQNLLQDYAAYNRLFSGTRNAAFLCGDQLLLFRLFKDGNKIIDCRISFAEDPGYAQTMQKDFLESSGWVPTFERYKVKNLQLVGGKLKFEKVSGVGGAVDELDKGLVVVGV